MINNRVIPFLLTILVLLSACQAAPPKPAPVPLAGASASVLGASALTIQGKLGGRTFHLAPVLADTGQPTPGFTGIEVGSNIQYEFSPDRAMLALTSYNTSTCRNYCLHLIDLRAWKEIVPPVDLAESFYSLAVGFAFDAAATRLAIALNDETHTSSEVVVVDLKSGKIMARAAWDANVYHSEMAFDLRFTPAGDLALYGAIIPPGNNGQVQNLRAVLLDGATLEVAWQQDLTGVRYGSEPTEPGYDPVLGRYLDPGVVFAPDGSKLYLVAADRQELTTVDFARRSVSSLPIRPPQSLLDRLMAALAGVAQAKMLNGSSKTAVISPDGARLYVVGQTMTATKLENGEYTTEITPHGLQVIDPHTGAELAKLDTKATYMTGAPDGSALFLTSWPAAPAPAPSAFTSAVTEIFDPAAAKITRSLPGEIHATRLLNSELAWVENQPLTETSARLSIYAPGSHALRSQWVVEDGAYADWVLVP